jgi:condensin complex subunit 3
MPGRTAARSARPSTASTKSSAPSFDSRVSTASRISTAVPKLPEDGPSTQLRIEICTTFADSQKSTSGHRKLVVRLRKIQEACCYFPQSTLKKKSPLGGSFEEADFNTEVERCVLRVMGVRKAEAAGDRIIRFLGLFLKSASEKDLATFGQDANGEETQTVPETPTSRLTFSLLSLLIPILSAKEKTVRYRATQIISHVVNTLDSIDDELYHLIRQGLTRRIRDKEPTIRIQAVMGLGRLAGNEVQEEPGSEHSEDMDSLGLLEKLLDVLQHDASAEVRRSLLLNLPLTPATLPYLLERARLLPTLGDFRHLSLSMREKLLRWGLRDRDENVRKAAGHLFYERWIEDCAGNSNETSDGGPVKAASSPNIQGLLELLERIDVVNSGVETGIALEAMKEFWQGRPDYIDAVNFDDSFWGALTSESVFMARSFNDFCQQNQQYQIICEEKMPEVTRLGFYLQKYINTLLEGITSAAELGGGEEETVEQEFIVEQLLHIALTLDYSDEVGRRKMFSLLREGLAMASLPEEVTRLVVEVIRLVCGSDAAGEREFCSVVLEAIAEVHDNIATEPIADGEEDSFVSARSEVSDEGTPTKSKANRSAQESAPSAEEDEQKVIREIMINMKCLHITQCMLQNVDGNLQQNMHLVTMLNNLVVPAVRSHEAPIRERGLLCLGLCCLLDHSLAEENITLFIHCFSKGHENLQITALQILCDIITTHPDLLHDAVEDPSSTITMPAYQKPLFKCFTRALKPTSSPAAVQSTAATSISKLLLTSRLNITQQSLDSLLTTLVTPFFDPRTSENAALRQVLAYFLPVYVHSRLENCQRMARVAVQLVGEVLRVADECFMIEAEEDSDGEVDESVAEKKVKALMTTVVGMVAEWTDPRKVVVLEPASGVKDSDGGAHMGDDVQLGMAEGVLQRILDHKCGAQERKYLLTLLGKLYIPMPTPTASAAAGDALEQATRVKELLDEAIAEGVAVDAAGKNGLVKVKNAVLKFLQGAGTGTGSGRKSGITMRGGSSEEDGDGEQEQEQDLDIDPREDHEDIDRACGGKEEEEEEIAGVIVREQEGDVTTTRMMETLELGESEDDLL